MTTADHIMGGMILLTLIISLFVFATMACTLRRPLAKLFAWSIFVVYLGVTGIAADLVLG